MSYVGVVPSETVPVSIAARARSPRVAPGTPVACLARRRGIPSAPCERTNSAAPQAGQSSTSSRSPGKRSSVCTAPGGSSTAIGGSAPRSSRSLSPANSPGPAGQSQHRIGRGPRHAGQGGRGINRANHNAREHPERAMSSPRAPGSRSIRNSGPSRRDPVLRYLTRTSVEPVESAVDGLWVDDEDVAEERLVDQAPLVGRGVLRAAHYPGPKVAQRHDEARSRARDRPRRPERPRPEKPRRPERPDRTKENPRAAFLASGSPFDQMAEREGFEPSMEFNPHTRLAGECLQPLGHLSGAGQSRPLPAARRSPPGPPAVRPNAVGSPAGRVPSMSGRTRRGGRAVECGGLENR